LLGQADYRLTTLQIEYDIPELWLSLFNAKTEEELMRLSEMEVPEMREAISAYRQITVTTEFQEAERLRSKAWHDEAYALFAVRQEGRQEGMFDVARNLLGMGDSVEKLVKVTGLTREEIETLW
jgi:hypothetical protein